MKLGSLLTAAVLAALPAFAHAADPPDFTGAWTVKPYTGALKPVDGQPIPFKPEARAEYDKRLAASAKGDTSWDGAARCLPEGLPRIMIIHEPFEILQKPNAMYFVAQSRVPWRAYFGEALPADPDPLYMGYSIARWDGPTLVVESSGFRDVSAALDDKGLPHSEHLHLTQRFHMGAGAKTMTVEYTIDDPADYQHPWTARAAFARMPASFQFPEEVCAAKLATTAPNRK